MNRLVFAVLIVGLMMAGFAPVAKAAPAQSSGGAKIQSNSVRKARPLDAQYQDRFASYEAEINDSLASQKMSEEEANSCKTKLYRLKRLEFDARKDSFDPADVAHLNKEMTKFQKLLTDRKRRPAPDKSKTEDKPE